MYTIQELRDAWFRDRFRTSDHVITRETTDGEFAQVIRHIQCMAWERGRRMGRNELLVDVPAINPYREEEQ